MDRAQQPRTKLWNNQFVRLFLSGGAFIACAHIAGAQCFTFSSGSAASLTVNFTQVPSPTMPEPGIYQYISTSGLAGTASLTLGSTTYSPASSPPLSLDLVVGDDPSINFSDLVLSLGFTSGSNIAVGATVSTSWSGNVFPNGTLPATLPTISGGSNSSIDVVVVGPGSSVQQSFTVTSVASCSVGQPTQPVSPIGTGPTLQILETYKGSDPQSCSSVPAPSNLFNPTDPSVNVFLELNNVASAGGDAVTMHWISPAHVWAWTTTWGTTPGGSSTQCFYQDFNATQYIGSNWGVWQLQAYINGNPVGNPYIFQAVSTAFQPTFSVLMTHTGTFVAGQNGAACTISLENSGAAASSGQVTVVESLPAGLTLVSMSGWGWNCAFGTSSCTRSDSLNPGSSYPVIDVTVNVASNAPSTLTNHATVSGGGAAQQSAIDSTIITPSGAPPPKITPGGIAPVGGTVPTIQSGEWVSIYGTNLANSFVSWNGDFSTVLGGTSVTINGKAAYLSYVSPGQVNLQAPDDAAVGTVGVTVTTASGSASSTVTLAQASPALLRLDTRHAAGIIVRTDGTGAYGVGTYDILGPTGTSLTYRTVAAKAGDLVELFGVGFGPTNPTVAIGKSFFGAAATTSPVTVYINGVSVTPAFAGLSGAGLYQLNFVVPANVGTGEVAVWATVGGLQTPSGVVFALQ